MPTQQGTTPPPSIDWDLVSSHSAANAAAEYYALVGRLRSRWPDLTPIDHPPRLWNWKPGTGGYLLGRRGEDVGTDTYVTTYAVTVVCVPVMFLDSYRVRETPRGNILFLGREPLSRYARAWNILVAIAGLAVLVLAALRL